MKSSPLSFYSRRDLYRYFSSWFSII